MFFVRSQCGLIHIILSFYVSVVGYKGENLVFKGGGDNTGGEFQDLY